MCGECCYGEGGIVFAEGEVERVAGFLSMDRDAFVEQYCEHRHGRLYARTGGDGYCVFFDRVGNCLIHQVKPARCLLWPFFPALVKDRDTWEAAKDACPGLDTGCTFEQFVGEAGRASGGSDGEGEGD